MGKTTQNNSNTPSAQGQQFELWIKDFEFKFQLISKKCMYELDDQK